MYPTPAPPVQPAIPWRNRPGGPQLRLSPGINAGKLLCAFQITAERQPGGVEVRWVGAGTSSDWTEPMHENAAGRYQMKPAEMNPAAPNDSVAFEVRFYLDDGLHGGRWLWPLEQHEKGHWLMEAQKGSGVFQPSLEDTW